MVYTCMNLNLWQMVLYTLHHCQHGTANRAELLRNTLAAKHHAFKRPPHTTYKCRIDCSKTSAYFLTRSTELTKCVLAAVCNVQEPIFVFMVIIDRGHHCSCTHSGVITALWSTGKHKVYPCGMRNK